MVPKLIATPLQPIDIINNVLEKLFSYKRPSKYNEIAVAVGLHQMTVSQALSASRDLGLTMSGGSRGSYILSPDGESYTRSITAKKIDDAQEKLKEILLKSPRWNEIILFLKATKNEPRDPMDLVIDVEEKLSKKWSSKNRSRLKIAYVSILSYAKLVSQDNDNITSLFDVEDEQEKKNSDDSDEDTKTPPPTVESQRETLETNEFKIEIELKQNVISFARIQINAWMDYLEKKIDDKTIENNNIDS